ncbi:MAG: trimeric intracellular cation channel family protein [Lentisphaeria bacterium]|nr:trimeric intracellular cation channel family protein [Lentisphaeria bacterium]
MRFTDPVFQTNVIYLFDMIGTVIFAITGGIRGARLKLDLLGVIVFACTVGVGGGMVRDMLIGNVPVTAFRHGIYLVVCILTGLIVFFLSPLVRRGRDLIQIFDAFGLGVFTAIGAAKGVELGLSIPGILLSGVITAVGGGVIRDIMSCRIPVVLTSDFYATAAILGAGLYLALAGTGAIPFFWMFLLVMAFVTGIRLLAVHYKVRLPVSGGKTAFFLYRRYRKKIRNGKDQ